MKGKMTALPSLEIRRHLNVPRDRVYEAWSDPAQLREWFGPETTKTHSIIADVRVGGEFRWEVENCDGERMTMRGEYREVEPGRKLVFTWRWDDDELWKEGPSLVRIELSDRDGGTEVLLRHEQLPSEESRDKHREGWGSVLDKLAAYVAK